jgi:nucleotide-binding universal stress UspA family protein
MPYKTILIHVDAEGECSRRIATAVDLAKRWNAALIGVGGWTPGMGFADEVAVIDEDPVQNQIPKLIALKLAAEKRLRGAAKAIKHVEWRGDLQLPLTHLLAEARSADLVVIGQHTTKEDRCVSLYPPVAVLRMGRPVLTVPANVARLSGARIVIGWKDCREARRAVRDALPLLQEADEVKLVEVSESVAEEEACRGMDDVAAYLDRYRVNVAATVYLKREDTIASDLIRFIERDNADLVVTGAYGHSYLGEWIFGGVTQDLLEQSPVCCLFSH